MTSCEEAPIVSLKSFLSNGSVSLLGYRMEWFVRRKPWSRRHFELSGLPLENDPRKCTHTSHVFKHMKSDMRFIW